MPKDYLAYAKDRKQSLRKIRQGLPEEMKAFNDLAAAAIKPGALSSKTKELIALAIAACNGCSTCITLHAQACVLLGATDEEVLEALGVAIYLGGGPAYMQAAECYDAFQQFKDAQE